MSKSLQRTLLFSQFLMLLALEMSNPFLPLFIASHGFSGHTAILYSALAFILPMITNIIMAPLWGMAADRFGYKPMLMRAAWTLVLTQGLMMMANDITAVLIIRVIQGGFAGFIAAMQMYVLSMDLNDNKAEQLASLQFSKALATSTAGITGGALLGCLNFAGLFFIAMALCLIATLILQKKLPATKKPATQSKKKPLTANSFFHLSGLGLLIILTQCIKFLPEPIFVLSVNSFMTDNAILIGLLYSMPAIGLFLSSNYCGKQFDRCRKEPAQIKSYLFFYSFLGCLMMLGHAFFTTHFIVLASIRLLWGIVLAALLPALFCLISDRYHHQGLAIGWANAFAKIGNLIGIILGGWLGSYLSIQSLFCCLACIYAVIALICLCGNFFTGKNSENLRKTLKPRQACA
ncbi:multidrug resistance efflux pump [Legionella beliardensis]|uniref:Multidrug resistance efflux pump n=1 Tax=Legionella beliardensis TaxID=91822 RepID=A0A378I4I6_9GAMM|nr:MFS transporter [Legionella beliardensis]STX30099.1 multidrug resistance efflux pump [Legionella beliardensis]